ncbi:MGH1-like glycoside hydrolase domain-containing protein [Bythopirellula goksoeyrii]|uniref:Beta-L-arabinobiosidase n=1 Tax=Bythopirellula goksoeyrii TaxID=1400387 RepID=A0A5B9QFP7_9BACT|nr:glycosyl hydrolase family 65 protein [Bythopirellula goksoeyrii]QEG35736.1 Beta-L-arabinobiosidase precursor [Bythopirellula goksoeyrii]
MQWMSVSICAEPAILEPNGFRQYVERFNDCDSEQIVNLIPNSESWQWIVDQAPLFECPSTRLEETYYFRWWTYRKHIKQTPAGMVLTEFILPVSHAGEYNTVSCAFGHQIAEGRWLRSQRLLDEYTLFWFRSGPDGGPADHFHKFSSWAAAALYDRYLVTLDRSFIINILPDLVADYAIWEEERQTPDGLFWQHDVKDGMEESISGGRREENIRPTINSYMAANALAISHIAALAGNMELSKEFAGKTQVLTAELNQKLWDSEAQFYKVLLESGEFSTAREAIGFIPWMFNLADSEHAIAWSQLKDPEGFRGPWGITTAERRHPEFRTHGTGTCEWDGAVWPFATSQTLNGLANLLRNKPQSIVTKQDFFEQLLLYAEAQEQDGMAYIGEYYDEQTGQWLITGPKAERSRFYNHSTFNDLVISGLLGIVPRADRILEVDPLIPENTWDWFCLDNVKYHDHTLTILWDRTGERYHRGKGLIVLADGVEIGRASAIERLTVELP